MATYTTGLITNTRATGVAASNIVVSSRNLGVASAMIVIEVFGVSATTLALSPIYVTGFMLAPSSADIREFFIAGNIAYEVQYSVTATLTQVAMSTYGIDAMGNLVADQRVLQSELTPTGGLSI